MQTDCPGRTGKKAGVLAVDTHSTIGPGKQDPRESKDQRGQGRSHIPAQCGEAKLGGQMLQAQLPGGGQSSGELQQVGGEM